MNEKIKHRIIGSVVLCALFVIFVPLIIKQTDSPMQAVVSEFIPPDPPSPPAVIVDPVEFPVMQIAEVDLDDDVILSAAVESESELVVDVIDSPIEPALVITEVPAEIPESASIAVEIPENVPVMDEPIVVAQPDVPGWMVQLASFANQDNAQRLAEQLSEAGYRVETVTNPNASGVLITRVIVGPEADREAAELLVDDLEYLVDLKGIVLQQEEG